MANEESEKVGLIEGGEVVRNWEKDMANLGALGIIRETFNIAWKYFRVFLLIHLTLFLPIVILAFSLLLFCIYLLIFDILPYVSLGFPGYLLLLQLSMFVILVPVVVMQSPLMAANIHAVGLIYTGRNVSFCTVLKGSMHAWPRLAATTAYYMMAFLSILYVFAGLIISTMFLTLEHQSFLILLVIVFIAYGVVLYYWQKNVCYVPALCVFDEVYGWAALKAGPKLMQDKLRVEGGVNAFFSAPFMVIFIWLWGHLGSWDTYPDLRNPAVAILAGCLIVMIALCTQLSSIAQGVCYVSFKSFRRESIFSASFLEHTADGGTEKQSSGAEDHQEYPYSLV